MSQVYIVAIVGMLLLLPLAPAIAIFWLLSTRQQRLQHRVKGGVTKGVVTIPIINFQMSFEAFGSTATYLVLLAFAGAMYLHMANEVTKFYAWRVSVPIQVQDPDGKARNAWESIYGQITATLVPFQNTANNRIEFWVVKDGDMFPQVNLAISGSPRTSIDLNDPGITEVDADLHRIRVTRQQVIRLMPSDSKP